MGILGAVIVAILVGTLNRIAGGEAEPSRGDPTTNSAIEPIRQKEAGARGGTSSLSASEVVGDWNMEYIAQDQNWKNRMSLMKDRSVTIPFLVHETPWGLGGQWTLEGDGRLTGTLADCDSFGRWTIHYGRHAQRDLLSTRHLPIAPC